MEDDMDGINTTPENGRQKLTVAQLTTKEAPSWCMACGDFTILSTLKSALVELDVDTANTLIV